MISTDLTLRWEGAQLDAWHGRQQTPLESIRSVSGLFLGLTELYFHIRTVLLICDRDVQDWLVQILEGEKVPWWKVLEADHGGTASALPKQTY